MSSVHWVYGDDGYQVMSFVREFSHSSSYETVDRLPDGASNEVVVQAVLGTSLFGEVKLVIAKDPQFLTQLAAPESLRVISDVLSSVPDGHTIVLVSTKVPDGRTKAVQALKKVAKVHEFLQFKDWEQGKVLDWFKSRIRAKHLSISPTALVLILESAGNDTGVLDQTLDLLNVYIGNPREIVVDDVVAVMGARSGSIFRLTEALRLRHHPSVIKELASLEDEGEDPVKILGIVGATLHQFWVTLSLLNEGQTFQEVGTLLERHPYIIQKSAPDIKRHYTVAELGNKILELQTLDHQFKSGQISASGMIPILGAILS